MTRATSRWHILETNVNRFTLFLQVHGAKPIADLTQQASIRTLFLENMLRAFMVALLATLQTKVSLERVLRLLFERRGARMETPSQVVYWVNTAGLSLANRRLLREIVDGLCAMDLQDQGKPIHVRLKDMPP